MYPLHCVACWEPHRNVCHTIEYVLMSRLYCEIGQFLIFNLVFKLISCIEYERMIK